MHVIPFPSASTLPQSALQGARVGLEEVVAHLKIVKSGNRGDMKERLLKERATSGKTWETRSPEVMES